MKRHILLALLIFLAWLSLLLFLWFVLPVQAAVLWDSYSDSARTVQSDNFDSPGAVIYMKGTGLLNNKTYRSTFYDGQGSNVCTVDGQSDKNGIYISQVKPSDWSTSSPGTWTAKLERVTGGTQLVATDTFTVTAQAIPEIPSVIGALILGVSAGLIYIALREGGII